MLGWEEEQEGMRGSDMGAGVEEYEERSVRNDREGFQSE